MPIEKVTVFVLRQGRAGIELLLFEHPYAGIQLPAGTVEVEELPVVAALREAHEETGLQGLTIGEYLGVCDEPLEPNQRLISTPTHVFARPDETSFNWAHFKRGLSVQLDRTEEQFSQVTYQEFDQYPNPHYVTYQITGWVPNSALTVQKQRHFYTLWCNESTAEQWDVRTDQHQFRLFWNPLDQLPEIVQPQRLWLTLLKHPHRIA